MWLPVAALAVAGLAACNLEEIPPQSIVAGPVACFQSTKLDEPCTADCRVQFDAACSQSAASYAWSFSNGASRSGVQVEQVFAGPGTYSVTLTVTDARGGTDTETGQVTISGTSGGGKPAAAFSIEPVVGGKWYEGKKVRFKNNSSGATSYTWTFEPGKTSNDTDPVYTFETAGNYTVQLTATNTAGADTETLNITIYAAEPFTKLYSALPNGTIAGLAQDTNGIIWVARYFGVTGEALRLSNNGTQIGVTPLTANGSLQGLAINKAQQIFVAGTDNNSGGFIKRLTSGGSVDKTLSLPCFPSAIKALSDGNIAVLGAVPEAGASSGETDVYFTKLDGNLNPIGTAQTFGKSFSPDVIRGIAEDANGELILTGTRGGITSKTDILTYRVSAQGVFIKETLIGLSGDNDNGQGVIRTSDNQFLVCGDKNGKIYLSKRDGTLGMVFQRDNFGAGTAYSAVEDENGALVFCGNFADNKIALKTDANATTTVWPAVKPDANAYHPQFIIECIDGGYTIAGYYLQSGNQFPFIVKTNRKGIY